MYDKTNDTREAERWKQGSNGETMSYERLADLAVHGFFTCEENCLSRKYCGDDACQCVRSIFPRPEFYELYVELRYLVLEAQAIELTREQ